MMPPFLSSLLTIFVLALIVILVTSPFESLQWWAGWIEELPAASSTPAAATLAAGASPSTADQFVIFLSGVGTLGGDLDASEQRLVDLLQAGLPGGAVLAGFFPFSVREGTLTEKRRTAPVWRWLAGVRERRPSLVARLIDWRNLTQVFVSMDPRYGPIYNKGVEEKLAAALCAHGYVVDSGVPITLIGYSGGAQISLGAAFYLHYELRSPVSVISLGGVLGDDPGLETVAHLYHLWGSKDLEAGLAATVVPARWRISRRSRWNRALGAGRVTQRCLGAMHHTGPTGYLDPASVAADGQSYLDVTASTMLGILEAGGLVGRS
jgi:hypothetical protein